MNMKRITALTLVCVLLVSGYAFAAETSHYAICVQIHTANDNYDFDTDLYCDTDNIYLLSSAFPDLCLTEKGTALDLNIDGLLHDISVLIMNHSLFSAVSEKVNEWLLYLHPEKKAGVYTGDVFDQASEMEYTIFSCGDLALLLQQISRSLSEESLFELLESEDILSILPEKNFQFELKMFDNRKYITVNVMDGPDVIMTVSADLSHPQQAEILIGYGLELKNYYHMIHLVKDDAGHFQVNESIYADDNRLGYRVLDDSDRIVSFSAAADIESGVDGKLSRIKFSIIMTPEKEDLPPFEIRGVYTNNGIPLLEANAAFSGHEDFSMHMTVDRDQEAIRIGERKVIDIAQEYDNAIQQLSYSMSSTLYMPILQMLISLPEGYMQLFINLE